MTTHATLRSLRTQAKSVYHVRGLRDGDSPSSPIKIQGLSETGHTPVVRNIVTLLTLGADLHIIFRHAASGGSSIQLANCAGGSTSTKSAWLRVTKIC